MKTKVFLAAMAVTVSFAMISCGNKAASNGAESTDSTAVAATCCPADSVACEQTAACDSTKACCKEKKECSEAAGKECCKDKKAACDKK